MNTPLVSQETQTWHTPGQIFSWFQQQHYRVFVIQFEDCFYRVQAQDPDGTWIELKVDPKTKTAITWKFCQ